MAKKKAARSTAAAVPPPDAPAPSPAAETVATAPPPPAPQPPRASAAPEIRAVTAGDTAKFEADVDEAFSGRQNAAALALAVKNAGAALQAEQAASGFSDHQAIRIYDDLVELSRTLGSGTPWA